MKRSQGLQKNVPIGQDDVVNVCINIYVRQQFTETPKIQENRYKDARNVNDVPS